MEDEYFGRLERAKRLNRIKEIRKKYKKWRPNPSDSSRKEYKLFMKGANLLHSEKVDPIEAGAVAHALMKSTVDEIKPYTDYRFYGGEIGALLYERIGKGRKAIPRLLDAMEYALEHTKDRDPIYKRADKFVRRNLSYEEVEESLRKPQRKQLEEGNGLTSRLSLFVLFIIVGLALSISSLSTTGYAVSNALGSGQGIGGILLFLIGLVGMFFSLRK